MLTTCTICGLALAVPDEREDSALCAGCLLANFGGQSVPDHWGPRLEDIPPVPSRRMRAALARVDARQRGDGHAF